LYLIFLNIHALKEKMFIKYYNVINIENYTWNILFIIHKYISIIFIFKFYLLIVFISYLHTTSSTKEKKKSEKKEREKELCKDQPISCTYTK
jgi:phosphotransferase system  glucose/maltose/N-acetylglucosamine-specific IIC component